MEIGALENCKTYTVREIARHQSCRKGWWKSYWTDRLDGSSTEQIFAHKWSNYSQQSRFGTENRVI